MKDVQRMAWFVAMMAAVLPVSAQPMPPVSIVTKIADAQLFPVGDAHAAWSHEQKEALSDLIDAFTQKRPTNFAERARFVMKQAARAATRGDATFDAFSFEDRELLIEGVDSEYRAHAQVVASRMEAEMCLLPDSDWFGRGRLYHAAQMAPSRAKDDATYALIERLTPDGARLLADRVSRVSGQSIDVDWTAVALASPGAMLKLVRSVCDGD